MSDSTTAPKITKSDEEWREQLTPEQYRILREHGTERAFSGPYWDTTDKGLYRCAACDEPLFVFGHEIRRRLRLAELFRTGEARRRHRTSRHRLWHGAHRNPLRQLRRPSRPCLPRRPETDRLALLHQRSLDGV